MYDLSEIARKRKELGWTQDKLAKEAGVRRSWITKAEQDLKNFKPSYFMVRTVLNVLDAKLLVIKMKSTSQHAL